MGAGGSKPKHAGDAAGPSASGLGENHGLHDLSPFDWGEAPTTLSEEEKSEPHDLVLMSVAHCKAKPVPVHLRRTDYEERDRRQRMAWRKRTSFIEIDCGDDSFFVSNTYKTIGITDGVGGWADQGVDSSLFSNELMRLSKWYSETHRETTNPVKIMTNGFGRLLHEGKVKAGGATCLIASLREESEKTQNDSSMSSVQPSSPFERPPEKKKKYMLDVANLGDSGGIVIRNGDVKHRFHEKSHAFNCPFQLSVLPAGMQGKAYSDKPSDAICESFPAEKGDVIILGTDGLFDNRFVSQICAEAAHLGSSAKPSLMKAVPLIGPFLHNIFAPDIHNNRRFVDPYRVVERIVSDAYKTSLLKTGVTPWVLALRDMGVEGADGGKVDDITCVIARVVERAEMQSTALW